MKEFQRALLCHSMELVHFRDRIGAEGVGRIFRMSVDLHEEAACVHQRSQIVAPGHLAFSSRY